MENQFKRVESCRASTMWWKGCIWDLFFENWSLLLGEKNMIYLPMNGLIYYSLFFSEQVFSHKNAMVFKQKDENTAIVGYLQLLPNTHMHTYTHTHALSKTAMPKKRRGDGGGWGGGGGVVFPVCIMNEESPGSSMPLGLPKTACLCVCVCVCVWVCVGCVSTWETRCVMESHQGQGHPPIHIFTGSHTNTQITISPCKAVTLNKLLLYSIWTIH